jgi:uncharacterized protein YegP (UPF0339 family)
MNKSYFKIYIDKAGYYRWRLVAGNGEIVASSEAYPSKQNAMISARRVKEIAWHADIVDNTLL